MTFIQTVDLTTYGGDFTADPYPVYAALRERGPVHHVHTADSGDMWLVVGYDEARAALADQRLSKDWRIIAPDTQSVDTSDHMLVSDPPQHTRLRKLVAREFTSRRMGALRPRVDRITDELITAMLPHGSADLLEALAFPLPMTVICELLGVPDLDRTSFRSWSNAIVGGADSVEDEQAAVTAMTAYLVGLIEDKRGGGPREDLLSALIRTRDEDGDQLSPEELVGMAFLLLVAGHETTVNLIGNGVLALLTHPDQFAALRADPGLMDNAIEEMLRYDGPLESATWRFTPQPVDIGGTLIPAGEVVAVVLASADRDPARFPAPDAFDIRRPTQGHLAFGHGLHHCLGAPLARLEATSALTALLTHCPTLTLATSSSRLTWRPGPLMRGLHHLPVRF
jgi:cytochrome P450